MTRPFQRVVRHLYADHGFDFVTRGIPPAALLNDLHAELHAQEESHGLSAHDHRWEVVDVHADDVVSPPFETELDAQRWLVGELGVDAGKEHVVRRVIELRGKALTVVAS